MIPKLEEKKAKAGEEASKAYQIASAAALKEHSAPVWNWMVVRFVFVFRVLVCARVSRVFLPVSSVRFV